MTAVSFPLARRTNAAEREVGKAWTKWSRALRRRYGKSADLGLVGDAFWFALHAHRGQVRDSGEPYVSHPLAVAMILTADGYPGDATVAAALLHDTVEDTPVRSLDVLGHFGPDVTGLVLGLTKLESLPAAARDLRTENLRKIFLVTFSDARVLLVKLADRLHNLETLDALEDPARAKRVAQESQEFYSPLAGRFGLFALKKELDDEIFRALHPGEHARLRALYQADASSRERALARVARSLSNRLKKSLEGPFTITHRVKNLHSTWRKMVQEGLAFEEIRDLYALRLVVPTEADCYTALGIVHGFGTPLHGYMSDYVAAPKANGYRSLHTVIEAPDWNRSVEVQIRTPEMDRIANWGAAAHWLHKGTSLPKNLEANLVALDRFRAAFGWTSPLAQPERFVEELQRDFFRQRVFAYTPQGDKIALPLGATALDFGFAVHTELGARTRRVLVNGAEVGLDHPIELGDEVEIVKAARIQVAPEWLDKVVTVQARREIRNWLRDRGRGRARRAGRRAFESEVARQGLHHLDLVSGDPFSVYAEESGVASPPELYEAIGRGLASAHDAVERLARLWEDHARARAAAGDPVPEIPERQESWPEEFQVAGDLDGTPRAAPCCRPVPGDPVSAVAEEGEVLVHRAECANLARREALGATVSEASWGRSPRPLYPAEVLLTVVNRRGTQLAVVSALSQRNINILDNELHIPRREVGYAKYEIEVPNRTALFETISRLNEVEGVIEARRSVPG